MQGSGNVPLGALEAFQHRTQLFIFLATGLPVLEPAVLRQRITTISPTTRVNVAFLNMATVTLGYADGTHATRFVLVRSGSRR